MLEMRGSSRDRGGRTVLLSEPDSHGWTLAQVRLRDRVLAGWRSLTLDRQLAVGEPASSSKSRAVRAGMLVAPAHREMLAASWERALDRHPTTTHAQLQWQRVAAAAADIQELAEALRVAQPVSPRGVAIASLLLTDGSGPLYHERSQLDLAAAVRNAIRYLGPCATPLHIDG